MLPGLIHDFIIVAGMAAIAAGRVPGLRVNRASIALIVAVALIVTGAILTVNNVMYPGIIGDPVELTIAGDTVSKQEVYGGGFVVSTANRSRLGAARANMVRPATGGALAGFDVTAAG